MTLRRTRPLLPSAPLFLVTAGLLAGGQTTSGTSTSATIENEVTASAGVVALDPATRGITLEREDGTQLAMIAGPEVRNFDQIEVGSVVEASYVEKEIGRASCRERV